MRELNLGYRLNGDEKRSLGSTALNKNNNSDGGMMLMSSQLDEFMRKDTLYTVCFCLCVCVLVSFLFLYTACILKIYTIKLPEWKTHHANIIDNYNILLCYETKYLILY